MNRPLLRASTAVQTRKGSSANTRRDRTPSPCTIVVCNHLKCKLLGVRVRPVCRLCSKIPPPYLLRSPARAPPSPLGHKQNSRTLKDDTEFVFSVPDFQIYVPCDAVTKNQFAKANRAYDKRSLRNRRSFI